MFDEKLLWKERFGRTSKELSRYLRYIFNGHLVIVMIFLLGTAAYYYQEWLKTVSQDFPSSLIMAVLLALILTYSPIFTFMSEADRIFLLPLETKLNGYFNKSLRISFFAQIYLLLIGLAVLMPLYAAVNGGNFKTFLPFLAVMLVSKYVNLKIRWELQFYREINVSRMDSIIRYLINLVFLYLLFSNSSVYFVLVVLVILIGLFLYYRSHNKEKGINWDLLIEQDESRMTSFYRLANLFTDVPKLKNQIKRRKWLDTLLVRIPFHKDQSFTYLYTRTFFRSGDYWGLFLRLTIIGSIVLYYLTSGIGQIVLAVLFLYLTGFQLLPLWRHHQNHTMFDLYPISEKVKEVSFLRMLRNLLLVQTIIFVFVLLLKGEMISSLIALLAGMAFSIYFVSFFSKRKINS